MTRSGIVRISGAVLVALSATAMFAVSTASASGKEEGHHKPPPPSGDNRAVSHSGNVIKCKQIGLAGLETIDGGALVAQGFAFLDQDEVNATILSAPEGKTYQAIVVKGGDAYNLYEPGQRGLSVDPPYSELHSPLVGKHGNRPKISHWFVCVGKDHGPTTTPPPATTPPATGTPTGTTTGTPTGTTTGTPTGTTTGTPTGTTTGTPTGGPSETPSEGPTDTPTESPTSVSPVSNGGNGGNLANTGFNTGLSLTLAGILLAAGLMMVLVPGRLAVVTGRLRRRH